MINVCHPIIFLEIDGPLASRMHLHKVYSKGGNSARDRIDPLCCNNLQRIVDLTDAQVVISSNWRKYPSNIHDLMKFLYNYNIPIIGMTTDSHDGSLEHEIQTWLDDHYVIHDCYVIINDDDTDLESFKDHLVVVSGDIGMRGEDTEKAVNLIERFRPSLDAVKDLSSIERLRIFQSQK